MLFNMNMKTIDLIYRENLQLLIKETGGVRNLAERIGKSYAQVSQWKNASKDSKTGRPRSMSADACREIEVICNKPTGWMDTDHSQYSVEKEPKTSLFAVENNPPTYILPNTALAPDIIGVVPLISWVQAGAWCATNDIHLPSEADEFYPTTAKVGINAYALKVRGDSMEPKFPDGCIIIVDPSKEAINNSYVVVREADTDEATFKQLQIDGSRKYLKPLNPRYPVMELRAETLICGVVVKLEMDV